VTNRNIAGTENLGVLDGLIDPASTPRGVEEAAKDIIQATALTLSAQALAAHPESREDALTGLREVLMAVGLVPDPDALGCNMGENFHVGNRRVKKGVRP
jgi:hypothetical protein